jgi:hypothetical protein
MDDHTERRIEEGKRWEKINKMAEDLAVLTSILKGNGVKGLCQTVEDQGIKIEALDNEISKAKGIWAGACLIGSAIVAVLTRKI